MEIKILGTGCSKCKKLEKTVRRVNEQMQFNANIEKVEDLKKIMEYGILQTPGLVVDGELVLSGHLPSENELIELLNKVHH